jgi:hypothetical protein
MKKLRFLISLPTGLISFRKEGVDDKELVVGSPGSRLGHQSRQRSCGFLADRILLTAVTKIPGNEGDTPVWRWVKKTAELRHQPGLRV